MNNSGQNSGFDQMFELLSPFWVIVGVFVGGIATILLVVLPLLNKNGYKNNTRKNKTPELIWGDLSQSSTVEVELLSSEELLRWFDAKRSIKILNENIIAFSLAGSIISGDFNNCIRNEAEKKYCITQGFYNKENSEVLEFRVIKSVDIDEVLLDNHKDGSLNVYK